MDRKTILDKINKLLALSESPNRFEAERAAAQAAELIRKYSIEALELDRGVVTEDYFDFIGKRKLFIWEKMLVNVVCSANFVAPILDYRPGGITVIFVGREANILAVKAMFHYLHSFIEKMASKIKYDRVAFREGFVYGLKDRFDKKPEGWGVEEEKALVLVKNQDEAAINKYKLEKFKTSAVKGRALDRSGSDSFSEGFQAAQHLNMNRQFKSNEAALRLEGPRKAT